MMKFPTLAHCLALTVPAARNVKTDVQLTAPLTSPALATFASEFLSGSSIVQVTAHSIIVTGMIKARVCPLTCGPLETKLAVAFEEGRLIAIHPSIPAGSIVQTFHVLALYLLVAARSLKAHYL